MTSIQSLNQFPPYGDFINYTNDAVFSGVCNLCQQMIRDNMEVFAFHPREIGNLSKHIYHSSCIYYAWKKNEPLPGQCPTCKSSAPLVARVHAVIQILCRMLDRKRLEKRMKQWFTLGGNSNHWLVALDIYSRYAVYLGQSDKILSFFSWWYENNTKFSMLEVFPLVLNKLRYDEKVQAQFLIEWAPEIAKVLGQLEKKYETCILNPEDSLQEQSYYTLVVENNDKETKKISQSKENSRERLVPIDSQGMTSSGVFSRTQPSQHLKDSNNQETACSDVIICSDNQTNSANDPYSEPIRFMIDRLDFIVVSGNEKWTGDWQKVKKIYSKYYEIIARCNSVYRIQEMITNNKPHESSVMDRLLKREAN